MIVEVLCGRRLLGHVDVEESTSKTVSFSLTDGTVMTLGFNSYKSHAKKIVLKRLHEIERLRLIPGFEEFKR